MATTSRHTRSEWAFLAVMVTLCGVLTVLQYRWTGELARAEEARLRRNLGEQAQIVARDFDDELSAATAALVPTAGEVDSLGRDAACAARLRQWLAKNPRPLFSRIAIAAPATGNGFDLFALDLKTQKVTPMTWPAGWGELRDHLGRRGGGPPTRDAAPPPEPRKDRPVPERAANPGGPGERRDKPLPPPPPQRGPGAGAPPAYMDRNGALTEFLIPGGHAAREGGAAEMGWMIMELDLSYVSSEWLPQLVRQHLDPDGRGLDDVVVRAPASNRPPIFSQQTGNATGAPDVALEFNHEGRTVDGPRGLSPKSMWTLEVWHRHGAFEAMVGATRWRNLAVAAGLNLLIVVAGVLLVRHTRQSRRLAEAQMSFVANVSHELRTPLTVIRGAAHNLERGVVQDPERVSQYLRLIIDHGNQLSAMVEQVLEYAAAQRTPGLAAREPVAIDTVLTEAIANAAHEIENAQCEVEFRAEPKLPAVAGDAAALRRAFQNLIANAARHGGEGGWIGVTVHVTNGSAPPAVEVEVRDRGPGIPAQEQTEIFKPFIRGAAAQSRQVRGSGLGLSLVREIVEAHGGTVTVSSREGEGAKFIVKLPAQ